MSIWASAPTERKDSRAWSRGRLRSLIVLVLVSCAASGLRSAEVQVQLRITQCEVPWRLENLAVCAELADADRPVYFELKSSMVDVEKRQVTQVWGANLREGGYDVIVRDEPNMMGVLQFTGKKVIVASDDPVALNFELIYNELIVIPRMETGSSPVNGSSSLTMNLRERLRDGSFAQYQRAPLFYDKKRHRMVARFYFIRNSTYECLLQSVSTTTDGLPTNKEWVGEVKVLEPIPLAAEVVFKEQK